MEKCKICGKEDSAGRYERSIYGVTEEVCLPCYAWATGIISLYRLKKAIGK